MSSKLTQDSVLAKHRLLKRYFAYVCILYAGQLALVVLFLAVFSVVQPQLQVLQDCVDDPGSCSCTEFVDNPGNNATKLSAVDSQLLWKLLGYDTDHVQCSQSKAVHSEQQDAPPNKRRFGRSLGAEQRHKIRHLRSRVRKADRTAIEQLDQFEDTIDWVWLTPNSKVEKTVVIEYCTAIHGQCAKRGRKLRGSRGPKGPSGPKGTRGETGMAGKAGLSGPMGPPGEAGVDGIDGRDGICQCNWPDFVVKEVTVPVHYPPEILIKEVEVPVGQTLAPEVYPVGPPKTVTECPTHAPTSRPRTRRPRPPLIFGSRPTIIPTRTDPPGAEVVDYYEYSDEEYVLEWPPPPPGEEEIEIFTTGDNETAANETIQLNVTTALPITSTEGYTGPPTLGYNRRRCLLDAVGTPVLHAESQFTSSGAWMLDMRPTDRDTASKRWVVDGFFTPVIYQYKNERDLREKRQEIKYYIDFLSTGTGMLICNGSMYYHEHDSDFIVKYNLNSTRHVKRRLPSMAYQDCKRRDEDSFRKCPRSKRQEYLYDQPHNFVDFAVDENGLWVVYHYENDTYFVISKLEFEDLHIVQTWNITMPPNVTSVANSFIMCGVFYTIQSGTDKETSVNFAYDLYQDREIETQVMWTNPYGKMTMVDYNPSDRRVYFYDHGYMLSVPLRVKRFISTTPLPMSTGTPDPGATNTTTTADAAS